MKRARFKGSHAADAAEKEPRPKKAEKKAAFGPFSALGKRNEPDRAKSPVRWKMVTAIFLVAVLIIAVAAVLIDDLDARDYDRLLEQALDSMEGQDYDSALSYLRRAEELSHSEECLMLMADCYEAQDQLELALEQLRQLDTTDPSIDQRIQDIERRRLQRLAAEYVNLAGMRVPREISSLVLDGLQVTGEDLETLSGLHRLSELSLAGTGLSDVSPLTKLGGLISLNLSGNSVEDLSPLTALTGLRTLYLDENPVTDLSPLSELKGLAFLSVRGLQFGTGELEALSAALPNCAIHSDADQKELSDITIGGLSFRSDVAELNLSGKGIRDISVLQSCKNLRQLNLSGNEIADLSAIMNLPSLERLDISDNRISDLRPLIGMNTLRAVNASNNQITDTASAGAMAGLTELRLSNNPIADFSGLEKLQNLRILSLKETGLGPEDLSTLENLGSLRILELDDNPDLTGEAVDSLQHILGGCVISHSQLVYSAEIGGLTVPGDVEELDLSESGIADLAPMTNLYNLVTLDLSGNGLSNIYIFQYTRSRLTLVNLDLSDNQVQDITPIASLTALENLDLSNNRVDVLTPLKEMKKLKSLNLSGNPLSEEQISELRAALPDCAVLFN